MGEKSGCAKSIDQGQQWETIYQNGQQSADLAWDFVLKFVEKYKPARPNQEINILEVGSGVGNNLIHLAKLGYYTFGVEFSDKAIKESHLRAEAAGVTDKCAWVQQSFTRLPCRDESFDLVIDRGSLCYVSPEEQKKAIAEIGRVLKKRGVFLFTPYNYFDKYQDGKNIYDFPAAMKFLPDDTWHVSEGRKYDSRAEIDGPVVCSFFAITAFKI